MCFPRHEHWPLYHALENCMGRQRNPAGFEATSVGTRWASVFFASREDSSRQNLKEDLESAIIFLASSTPAGQSASAIKTARHRQGEGDIEELTQKFQSTDPTNGRPACWSSTAGLSRLGNPESELPTIVPRVVLSINQPTDRHLASCVRLQTLQIAVDHRERSHDPAGDHAHLASNYPYKSIHRLICILTESPAEESNQTRACVL